MNNTEEYRNLISLLQEALKFYANADNYEKNVTYPKYSELFSYIEMDVGTQARFALKQVQDTLDMKQKMEEDYEKLIDEAKKALGNVEDIPTDLMDTMKTLKDINDGN